MLICAFPGTGKSTLSMKYPDLFFDLDSGTYSKNPDGTKNKNFPNNYIEAILQQQKIDQRHVLVATHHTLIQRLIEMGIEFIVITPKLDCLDEYMRRYRARKSPLDFCQQIHDNWERYVGPLTQMENAIVIDKHEYVADVVDMFEAPDPLAVKFKRLKNV